MPPQTDDLKVGGKTFKHIGRAVKSENLDEKWSVVPDRPTPSDDDVKLMSMLDERLGLAKDAKQKKHDIWNVSYLQYRSVNHTSLLYGGYPTYWNAWGSGVFIPRTFETIESVKVQMLGRRPDFSIEPTTPKSSSDADSLNRLVHSEWNRSDSHGEVVETVHDCLVYGAGLVRTDLINKKKNEHTLKWKSSENGELSVDYQSDEVQKYYGVGCRRVDPYDFYPNPSPEAFKMSRLGWGFERSVTDAWDLREEYRMLHESGANGVSDNWKYLKPGGDVQDYKYLRKEVDTLYGRNDARYPGTVNDLVAGANTMGVRQSGSVSKGQVEVWEYWEDDRYIVIANGLILRDSPNPYPHKTIPYVKYSLIDMNEFWSMGFPEYLRWLQITENVLYDQGLNNIIMSVHKMFAVNSRYIEDEGELVARPFGIIHLKQMPNVKISDAIMPLEYSQNMGNYFEFMRMNTQNIQTVTGVSPYQTGGITKESKVERATVANRLTFAGSARIREIARHLEDSLMKGTVEHFVAIIQFYYQNAEPFKEEGLPVEITKANKTFYLKYLPRSSGEITEEDRSRAIQEGYVGIIAQDKIQGRYKVVVRGGSSLATDPDEKARLKLELFKIAQTIVKPGKGAPVMDAKTGQMSPMMVPVFDIERLSEEIAREVFEISDPEEYLYKEPEPEQPPAAGGGAIPPEMLLAAGGASPNPAVPPETIPSVPGVRDEVPGNGL